MVLYFYLTTFLFNHFIINLAYYFDEIRTSVGMFRGLCSHGDASL